MADTTRTRPVMWAVVSRFIREPSRCEVLVYAVPLYEGRSTDQTEGVFHTLVLRPVRHKDGWAAEARLGLDARLVTAPGSRIGVYNVLLCSDLEDVAAFMDQTAVHEAHVLARQVTRMFSDAATTSQHLVPGHAL